MSAQLTFRPWRVRGNQRIISGERQWRKPLKWNSDAELIRERFRVLVDVDVFEDWDGVYHQSNGVVLGVDDGGRLVRGMCRATTTATSCDVLDSVFALIDCTPNIDWLLTTRNPENVRRMWPVVCCVADDIGGDGQTVSWYRPNVWLGVSVSTQADADQLIPELLKYRELCAKLFVSATLADRIDITPWLVSRKGYFADVQQIEVDGKVYRKKDGVDLVLASGEGGAIESLKQQCDYCGVPMDVPT